MIAALQEMVIPALQFHSEFIVYLYILYIHICCNTSSIGIQNNDNMALLYIYIYTVEIDRSNDAESCPHQAFDAFQPFVL